MKKVYLMKKILLLVILMTLTGNVVFSNHYTIINVGTTFSPDTLAINAGDTVTFSIISSHNAVEVSKATYEANGSTKNGGFSLPYGGGTVIFNNGGTYYYVCQPHAYLKMKGMITVSGGTSVNTLTNPDFNVFPNPASENIKIVYSVASKSNVSIKLVDEVGKVVSTIVSGTRNPGQWENIYTINNSIKSGIYFLTINVGGKSYSKKLTIIK
jgi:plastocyanin